MNKEEWIALMIEADASRAPKKVCSDKVPGADLAMAYEVQSALDKARGARSPISGFKGALTAKAAQQSMGLADPASGVLFEEMRFSPGCEVPLEQFSRLVVETEIGFCVGREISQPISYEELPDYIAYNLPMIELADIGFDNPGAMTAFDFIAGGAAACGYIAGEKSEVSDVNNVEVRLTCDGELLHEGKGSEVLGDQSEAAVWLVNQVVRQGYVVKPGHLLMTGSLGRIQMVTSPGSYIADYAEFGKIEFVIR